MIDVDFDNLQQILISMPELRRLDGKKNRVGLDYEDNQRWTMLYGRVIRLFGKEHEELAEQRRTLRIPLRIKVDYEVDREKFHSMSHDISVNGIALGFTHVIPLNAVAKMEIGIQFTTFLGLWKKKFVPINARVRWISQEANRIGFEFVDLAPHYKDIIQETIYTVLNRKVYRSLEAYAHHAF